MRTSVGGGVQNPENFADLIYGRPLKRCFFASLTYRRSEDRRGDSRVPTGRSLQDAARAGAHSHPLLSISPLGTLTPTVLPSNQPYHLPSRLGRIDGIHRHEPNEPPKLVRNLARRYSMFPIWYSIRAAQQDSAFKMTHIEAKSINLWLRHTVSLSQMPNQFRWFVWFVAINAVDTS